MKPTRYTGGELNSVIKNPADVDVRFGFCFADTYEIAMSHLGLKILYHTLNDREDTYCERVFAPWTDMEEEMKKHGMKLFALETGDEITHFDCSDLLCSMNQLFKYSEYAYACGYSGKSKGQR